MQLFKRCCTKEKNYVVLDMHFFNFTTKCKIFTVKLQKAGHPDKVDQSQSRTETIDFNIIFFSQWNVEYRTMKFQLVCSPWKKTRYKFWLFSATWLILTTRCGWQIEAMSVKKKLQAVWKQKMRESHRFLDLQIKVLDGFQIISSIATSLPYGFNRSSDRTMYTWCQQRKTF